MNKLLNISTSVLLAFSILFGYTGIPVYKMICSEDGHVVVSIVDQKQSCDHHRKEVKSCCSPVTTESSCCDYSSDFLKLQSSTLVKEAQTGTGHVIPFLQIPFPDLSSIISGYFTDNTCLNEFSRLCVPRHNHSIQISTQNFRI